MTVHWKPGFGYNTVDKAIAAAVRMAAEANDVVYMTWNDHEFPVYKDAEHAAYALWSAKAYAREGG